jgi:hypothetical protein
MGTDAPVIIPAFEQWFHDHEYPSKIKEDLKDAWISGFNAGRDAVLKHIKDTT